MPTQCKLVTRPATKAVAGELTAASSMTYRGALLTSGTSATRWCEAMTNQVVQAISWRPIKATNQSHILDFFSLAAFILFLLFGAEQSGVGSDEVDCPFQG